MSDFDQVVQGLLRHSYAIFPMREPLQKVFERIPGAYAELSAAQKSAFSFPARLDGFLPFGAEHAKDNPDHPDLCERFCYFRKYRSAHESSPMTTTAFYQLVSSFERGVAELSRMVLHALFDHLGAPPPVAPGAESYVQICNYNSEYAAKGVYRSYLMDPHHDGQLLTFIAQTEQGLMVEARGAMEPVKFSSSEIFVMAGQLLEAATDGELKGLLHAVTRNDTGRPRMSIMYFQNPCFEVREYISLRERRNVDFLALANQTHQSYGLPAYK